MQQLQQGLTKLKPAVEHIRIAADTSEVVVSSAKKSTAAVAALQAAQLAYYEGFKGDLTDFLEGLRTYQVQISETNLKQLDANFKYHIGQFEKSIDAVNAKFHQLATKRLDKMEGMADEELAKINQATQSILGDYKTQIEQQKTLITGFLEKLEENQSKSSEQLIAITQEVSTSLKAHQETTKKYLDHYAILVNASNQLVRTINGIDFPSRLEKIDNSISAVNLGISQLNLKIEPLERSIKEQQETHYQALLSHQKNNHIWSILLKFINLIAIVAIGAYLFYKNR